MIITNQMILLVKRAISTLLSSGDNIICENNELGIEDNELGIEDDKSFSLLWEMVC